MSNSAWCQYNNHFTLFNNNQRLRICLRFYKQNISTSRKVCLRQVKDEFLFDI